MSDLSGRPRVRRMESTFERPSGRAWRSIRSWPSRGEDLSFTSSLSSPSLSTSSSLAWTSFICSITSLASAIASFSEMALWSTFSSFVLLLPSLSESFMTIFSPFESPLCNLSVNAAIIAFCLSNVFWISNIFGSGSKVRLALEINFLKSVFESLSVEIATCTKTKNPEIQLSTTGLKIIIFPKIKSQSSKN